MVALSARAPELDDMIKHLPVMHIMCDAVRATSMRFTAAATAYANKLGRPIELAVGDAVALWTSLPSGEITSKLGQSWPDPLQRETNKKITAHAPESVSIT